MAEGIKAKISELQVGAGERIIVGNYYSPKHIATMLGGAPQVLNGVVREFLAHQYGLFRLEELFGSMKTIELGRDDTYTWNLRGRQKRSYPLLGAWIDAAGTIPVTSVDRPGANGQRLYFDFEGPVFDITMVIIHARKRENYHFRIMNDPIRVSDNLYRYEVQLVTNNKDFFIPAKDLVPNRDRFYFSYGYVEQERSKRGFSSFEMTSDFTMMNRLSALRVERTYSGNSLQEDQTYEIKFKIETDNGQVKEFTSLLAATEAKLWMDFEDAVNHALYYGKSTWNPHSNETLMFGESGNPVMAGYGLMEQIRPSNRVYYSKLTFDYFMRILTDLAINKAPSDRKFVVFTGMYGMMDWHKMVVEAGLEKNWMTPFAKVDLEKFIEFGRDASIGDVTTAKLRFGQFVGVYYFNGITVEFRYQPYYDSDVTGIYHPLGGPIDSRRFTVIDLGNKEEPKVARLKLKGGDPVYFTKVGIRSPYQGKGSPQSPIPVASLDDAWIVGAFNPGFGVALLDPTSVVEFIPNIGR